MRFFPLKTLLICATCLIFQTVYGNSHQQKPSCAETYSGISINAGVGGSGMRVKMSRFGLREASQSTYGDLGFAIQLKANASYGFYNYWFISLGGYGQYNSPEVSNTFTEPNNNRVVRNFKVDWSLGFDGKVGYVVCPSSLIYIYGGPDWGHYSFVYQNTFEDLNDKLSAYKLGGRFGAGLKQKLSKSWILSSSFDYTWYPSETFGHANGESHTLKPNLATFLFKIEYLF